MVAKIENYKNPHILIPFTCCNIIFSARGCDTLTMSRFSLDPVVRNDKVMLALQNYLGLTENI